MELLRFRRGTYENRSRSVSKKRPCYMLKSTLDFGGSIVDLHVSEKDGEDLVAIVSTVGDGCLVVVVVVDDVTQMKS